ncbi:hypothetical protein BKA70DRAFT_217748 [Coprinopsis sp. MPI-PUGE-AT-0042]|nr:hypothetical protein BKA70DRAFT_217748 [Coprinopsis sp. MPI-PUGE-AT-0042]
MECRSTSASSVQTSHGTRKFHLRLMRDHGGTVGVVSSHSTVQRTLPIPQMEEFSLTAAAHSANTTTASNDIAEQLGDSAQNASHSPNGLQVSKHSSASLAPNGTGKPLLDRPAWSPFPAHPTVQVRSAQNIRKRMHNVHGTPSVGFSSDWRGWRIRPVGVLFHGWRWKRRGSKRALCTPSAVREFGQGLSVPCALIRAGFESTGSIYARAREGQGTGWR